MGAEETQDKAKNQPVTVTIPRPPLRGKSNELLVPQYWAKSVRLAVAVLEAHGCNCHVFAQQVIKLDPESDVAVSITHWSDCPLYPTLWPGQEPEAEND